MIFELNQRKREILKAIVSDYIETAEPVGSSAINHNYIREVSPATIRAEMNSLEQIGYITHPYTSAGRIPTDSGYRYYVDNIMEKKNISGKEITLIKNGIKKIGNGIEEIVHGTVRLLSQLLNQVTVFIARPKANRQKIYAAGLSNALNQPDFKNLEEVRNFVQMIEREDFLTRIFDDYGQDESVNLHIGHENRFKEVKDLSVIVSRANLGGMFPGTIGIIGPTRMNYGRIFSIIDQFNKEANNIEEEIIHVRID